MRYPKNKIPWFIYLLAILLVTNTTFLYADTTYANQTLLSINLKNAKVVDVLDEIEQKSEFYFLYNRKLIDVERIVSISATRKTIQSILNEVFEGTDI